MLQEELWYVRLAELSAVQLETSQQLWRALCQQVEQRLLSGLSLTFPEIGEWKLEEHREYVARTADGKQWLIPPRLTLGLRPIEDRGVTSLSIDLLRDALSEATHVSAEQVATWLRAIPTLWRALYDEGIQIVWAGLGSFTPITSESGDRSGYRFLPSEVLCAALNKPFSMFAPVEVVPSSSGPDLELREIDQLDQLTKVEPIKVLFAPSEPIQEEVVTPPVVEEVVELVLAEEPQQPESPAVVVEEEIPPAPVDKAPIEAPQPAPSAAVTAPVEEDPFVDQEAHPRMLVWVFVALGIAMAFCLFIYLLSIQPELEMKDKASAAVEAVQPSPAPAVPAVPAQAIDETDTLQTTSIATQEESTSSVAPSEAVVSTASSAAETIERVRLRPGDRLSRLALKKYGNKAFWVYIYEENRAQLKDPDNIPVGAVITLPAASKYQINAGDTNSINRALVLQRSLHR
ncbi:MAG: LysM peptidoglycan-binding domain-containing protein [Porphyromonas pasteri]